MSRTPERVVIVNTSPFVYLHQVGQLDLLAKLYGRVVAPLAVQEELLEGHRIGANVPNLSAQTWIEIRSLKSSALLPVITDLGSGEAEVIGLARETPNSLVIMDDQLGRKIAFISGLSVTGTFGVPLRAKQEGHLPALEPIFRALEKAGFWFAKELINLILTKAGERL